jgi:acetyl-CoA synthetase
MSEKIYAVPDAWAARAHVRYDEYRAMYERSIADPTGFWAEQAQRIDWYRAPTTIKNTTFGPGDVSIKWFEDGVTNVAYNCIDRHLATRADQVAIIWEGDDPPNPSTSPTRSCMTRSAGSPTSCATVMSRRATGSRSTCR